MSIAYTKAAVDDAKTKGLYLVKVEINGRHAKRGSIEFAGPVGPETSQKILAMFTELLANPAERMK